MSVSKYQPQDYTDFIILDFEATCIKNARLYPQEIIEFPARIIAYDYQSNALDFVSEFHSYVRPIIHPKLSPFCTNFTGNS